MPLSKKIFLTSSIALIIILIFWGIYFLVFREASPEATSSKSISPSSNEQSIDPSAKENIPIEQFTDEAVLSPTLSADGQSIKYYSKNTGKAYAINILDRSKHALSNKELLGLTTLLWSPDTSKVISGSLMANNRSQLFLYDYIRNSATPLNTAMNNVVWQNNNKILYKYFDAKTKKGSLNIADPNGLNWQKILDIPEQEIVIAPVPRAGLVSFWNKPDAFTETKMQTVPVLGGESKVIAREKFGADYLWSLDGNNLLQSATDKSGRSKTQLGLMNSAGGEHRLLGIPSFVSKCAWSKDNKTIYYALPSSIPDNSILPNDYLNNKFHTNDTFWKINITTGEKTRLIDLKNITTAYDAVNLFLNSTESILFFTNKIDGKLYAITL